MTEPTRPTFSFVPPPELMQEWWDDTHGAYYEFEAITIKAAQWGADQELEVCVNYVDNTISGNKARALRAIRRPKPDEPVAEGPNDPISELVSQCRPLWGEVAAMAWWVRWRLYGDEAQLKPEGPTDEEIMELMPQQMRDDLAAAARALAGHYDTSHPIKAASAIRIILNRHAVDHARAVLAEWAAELEA